MSFVLDTDVCSAFIKRRRGLAHRFFQYSGRLHVPLIVLGELYTWTYRRSDPAPLLNAIENDLLPGVQLLMFDQPCAHRYGVVQAQMLNNGQSIHSPDLQIAVTALVHDFTLVTHNTSDFLHVPGLRLDDWLV
jgi:tRNA(fMet)-specific endonuclease VapC